MASNSARITLIKSARRLVSLGLNFDSEAAARTSKLWRVYGQLLIREIGTRHAMAPNAPYAQPYRLYEINLSGSPDHMVRFQNFMAETGIFTHIIGTQWLEDLPTADHVPITSLLRRIRDEDNVYHSYCNRLESVRDARNIDVLPQNEILPVWDFAEDVTPAGGAGLGLMSLVTKPGEVLSLAWKGFGFAVLLPVTFLLTGLVSLPLFALRPVRAWAARAKISALMQFDAGSEELAERLAAYELNFAHTPAYSAKMERLAGRTNMMKHLVQSGWIDHVPLAHRVAITSLFRRFMNNSVVAKQASNAGVKNSLSVLRQADLPQYKLPNVYQKMERKLFGKIAPNAHLADVPVRPKRPVKTVQETTEQALKKQGWLANRAGGLARVEAALLDHNYVKALKLTADPKLLSDLPNTALIKLAAIQGWLGGPMKKNTPLARAVSGERDVAFLYGRAIAPEEKLSLTASVLFPPSVKHSAKIRTLWQSAEAMIANDDELGVVGILGDLAHAYAQTPQNQITARHIGFDTFLITRLHAILDKAQYWFDWHGENPMFLQAFAYCAILARHEDLTATLLRIIQENEQIKPVFKVMLGDAYLASGIHSLDTIVVHKNLEKLTEISPLREFPKKGKTLCLVEGSADTDNLARLRGLTENTVCAPVQPVDATKFPDNVTQVQIEDLIPMYSEEDMEISREVDRLTSLVITALTKEFQQDEDAREWADFVEVVHATVFYSVYRDIMAVKLVEKMIGDIDKYDRVVFLLRNGQSMKSFIGPAVKALGRENVYFSVRSPRKADQDLALSAVRTFNKKRIPVADETPVDTRWRNGFTAWMDGVETYHERELEDKEPDTYALHLLEHVNGYFDSYANLINANLAHNNVELVCSSNNVLLTDYIAGDQITRFQKHRDLTRVEPRMQPPTARSWMPMLTASIDDCFDGVKSPLFPHYKDMILKRAQNYTNLRLVQILDLSAYFKARFAVQLPTNIFTGPNQHMASRTASIWGKKLGVPVYDFLILANTNHHRYRPPIADKVYLYDGWYRDIYENFFGLEPDQIRVSGPLFDYSKRLTQRSKTANKAGKRQHIVFFSQSANFDVNRMILQDVCKTVAGREDVYLTVKLHPHESPANVERYREIAKKMGVDKNISVWHKDAEAIDLVNQADLVVQSFSNIGLDSFLLKKPVITVKFSGPPHARIFLYEKGIGKEVKTRAALRKATKAFLDDPKAKALIAKKAEKFAKDNAHFLRPDNARRVMNDVLEDIKNKES